MKITLTSNNFIARKICIYAYQCIQKEPNINVNYLYDHTVPTWDYIPTKDRKKLKILCLSNGDYSIPYKDTSIQLTIQYIQNKPIICEHDVLKEVILECSDSETLIEFVEVAKKEVENLLNKEGRQLDTTFRKYLFDTTLHFPDWELMNVSKKRSDKTLFLPSVIRQQIFGFVQNFISEKTKQEYEDYGIPYKCNILFSGMPGSGKTTTIQCIASAVNSDIGIISFTRAMDDIQFTKAINLVSKLDNCRVLVLEDIDSLFTDERKQHDSQKNNISLSGILNCLDGLVRNEGIIVCITTNRKDVLDEAILRSGRMDLDIEFKHIQKEQVLEMIGYYYKDSELAEKFYEKVEYLSLTASDIQQFLFKYRNTPHEILKKYKELQKSDAGGTSKMYS